MKKIKFIFLLAIIITTGIWSTNVKAQEWNTSQKEVWKNVNDYWAILAKGDVSGFMEYFHPDYMGWEDNEPLPSSKDETRKWMMFSAPSSKLLIYEIKPVGIKIFGDIAIADYYFSIVRDRDGKKESDHGRWTDILMKQGSKWVLIGDNGGSDKQK
jgi:ketosteroid isomerase-like protein